MLLIITIILVVLVIVLSAMLYLSYLVWKDQKTELARATADYIALEEGSNEIADSYEQVFLSKNETIESQAAALLSRNKDIEILMHVATHHADNCIPDYAPILGEEEYETMNYYSESHDKYDRELAKVQGLRDEPVKRS